MTDPDDDAGAFGAWSNHGPSPRPSDSPQPTLALLEDLAAVLLRHGYPPLAGYALAELTSTLYRIA